MTNNTSNVELKSFLQSIKSAKGDQDLYAHLSNIFTKLLLEHPSNAYDFFEDYSYDIKSNGYDYKKLQDDLKRNREKYSEIKDFAAKAKGLIDKIMIGGDGDDQPQEPGACGYVPNFMEEAKWFEWAGVYFGEEQTFKIFKSLTKLSLGKQLKQVKFWGKIMGSQRDYYIAEGVSEDAGEQGELPPNFELKGANGVNKLSYWVTNDVLLGEWTELPLVSPEQLIGSRKIKYLFTGDLERKVVTNPAFFGLEKHLLKAQIVRISHATTIVPKGIWKRTEDDEREIEYNEEENWKFPEFDVLKSKENWVHFTPGILKQGRVVHFKPDFGPDADEEVEMKKIVAKDPFEPRLKAIQEDKATNGTETSWNLKVFGDSLKYDVLGFVKTQANYGVIAVKSMNWPGAITVLNGQSYASLYIGYGFKANNSVFFPKEPQKIQTEPNDQEEQPEKYMGSACAKSSTNTHSNPNPQPVVRNNASPERVPNTRLAQLQNVMNNEFASHLNLEHNMNINHKFADFFTLINNSYSGQGIKKTYSYISHMSKEDLIKKREEFWDTRTEGRPENWQTIKAAINEKEEGNSLAFLKASGLNLVKNSIQFVYDEHGKKYEVPVFCINEPVKIELKPSSASILPANFKKEKLKLKIRCAKANDLDIDIENTLTVKDIKAIYLSKMALDSQGYTLSLTRMFYKGKELKDTHPIAVHNVENEGVLQLFMRKNDS